MTESKSAKDVFQIIILDDNLPILHLAKATIEHHLSSVAHICSTPEEVYATAERVNADIFLLDVELGTKSGIDVCHKLKENPKTESIPVLFLSAYKEPSKRVSALNAGGVDYLDKPFYPEELVARLRIHMEAHRLRIKNLEQISEQQALLRVLCHDLVNPVFAAHSLLSLKHDLGQVNDSTVRSVIRCCQSALDIIQNVRTEHSLVSTDKQAEIECVLVHEAFEEAAQTLISKFEQKEVELVIESDPQARIRINKVVLVHNILINLLTNALKFSYPKSKVILKSYLSRERDTVSCNIDIKDFGIGMPPEILNAVFNENAKVSRKGTASELGTGFGMPLVKKYTEKYLGSLVIESTEAVHGAESGICGTLVKLRFPNQ